MVHIHQNKRLLSSGTEGYRVIVQVDVTYGAGRGLASLRLFLGMPLHWVLSMARMIGKKGTRELSLSSKG